MKINSLEDFDKYFDTEEKCTEFLEYCRWGNTVLCPYCGHNKIYIIENGRRRKCGNSSCYKKFTVTVNSFIHASNLAHKVWLYYIFMYARTKGRFTATKDGQHSFVTCYFIDEKIEQIFLRTNKLLDTSALFQQATMNIFTISDKLGLLKIKNLLGKQLIDPREIIHLSDENTYKRVVYFLRKLIWDSIRRKFIFYPFCTPEELIAETYISLSDSEIKSIDGQFFIKVVRRQLYKMWQLHVKDTPALSSWFRVYYKNYKQKGRINLSNFYIMDLLRKKGNKDWNNELSREELLEMIKFKRERISKMRIENNKPINIRFEEMIIREEKERSRIKEIRGVEY